MFYACPALSSLDVSNFNTAKVTSMYSMFDGCSSLTTIYCDEDWKSDVVTSSTDMFKGSTSLREQWHSTQARQHIPVLSYSQPPSASA